MAKINEFSVKMQTDEEIKIDINFGFSLQLCLQHQLNSVDILVVISTS